MKHFENFESTLARISKLRLIFALTALILAGWPLGCATPQDEPVESPDTVIGNPPPAAEDPFFVKVMPAEAVPVNPSGKIEADQLAEDSTVAAVEPEPVASDSTPGATSAAAPQCFSCVRICPTAGDCDEAREDVICGWGTHADAPQAKRLARAECNATLDMARRMPVWSRIDGQCPPATCR
jgi:hypothetical protein